MLKSGLFKDSKGEEFSVYIQEFPSYSRIDICESGAEYHLDVSKVVYSMFKKRKTFIYGDREVFNEFDSFLSSIKHKKGKTYTESDWKDGAFYLKNTKIIDDNTSVSTTLKNGKISEEIYKAGSMYFTSMLVLDNDVDIILEPLNKSEYISVEIDNSIKDDNDCPYVPADVLRSRYDLSWEYILDLLVLKTVPEVEDLIREIESYEDLIGKDYETTGLEMYLYGEDEVVGIVVSTYDTKSRYVPFAHTDIPNIPIEYLFKINDALNKSKGQVVAHNKKFEKVVDLKYGIKSKIELCSMIANIINKPTRQKGANSLKTIVPEIKKEFYLEFEHIFLDSKNINFAKLPESVVRLYACPDSINCKVVLRDRLKKMDKIKYRIFEIECELADLKAEQEYWGFRIDTAKYLEGYRNCESTISMLSKMIETTLKNKYDLNSPDVMSDLLYNRLKCPIYLRTKTNRPSTNAKAIKKLAKLKRDVPLSMSNNIKNSAGKTMIKADDMNVAKYPVLLLILKYREYIKLDTAFYSRIRKGSKSEHECMRFFSWINQLGAESGRQSSPMHQLPKEIKGCVLADSEDHTIYDTDYGQIELRLIASLAGEIDFINMCKDRDIDIHRAIGHLISGLEIWEIDAQTRQEGKQRNFGVVYLISGAGLADQMFGPGSSKEQRKKAQDSIDEFYRRFKNIKRYLKKNRETILEKGKIGTYFNRFRYFDEIFDPELPRDKREAIIRQGNNMPVQGTAADIMKIAEVNINRYIKQKGWDALVDTPQGKFPLVRCILSAHDEALVSGHKSIPAEEILLMKKTCMEMTIEGFAPLFAETCIVDNWEQGKDDQYAIPWDLRDKLIEDYQKTGKSSIDMSNPVQSMLAIINKHRDNSLRSYMEGLIEQYGLDDQLLADHVRHPSFTHELIARFKQTEEHKAINGKLSHIDSIKYAVDRYLEIRENNSEYIPKQESTKEKIEDLEMTEFYKDIVGISDEISSIDAEGNIVYEGTEEEEDDYYLTYDDEADFIQATTSGEKIYVWELWDSYTIDCDELTKQSIDKLLSIIYECNDPNGGYRVMLKYGERLLDSTINVRTLDKDEITKFMKENSIIKEV